MPTWMSLAAPLIIGIAGYAIGTAQVLFVDWVQRRREHVRQLRLLRAEFRRVGELVAKFGWEKGVPPPSDQVPYPPRVSDQFLPTVAAMDYYLTDEHEDDNGQLAHLTLLDSINHLQDYHMKTMSLVDQAEAEEDGEKARGHLNLAVDNAAIYDKEVDRLGFVVFDALREIERRLKLADLRTQVSRVGQPLPQGQNPPPVTRDDPRILEWKKGRT